MLPCPVCGRPHRRAGRLDAADTLAALIIAGIVRIAAGPAGGRLGDLVIESIAMQRCLKGQALDAIFPLIDRNKTR